MSIRTHRTWLPWSPLVGWALLACGASAVHAQSPTQSDVDQGTATPSVPAGGATEPIVTTTSPADSFRRDADRRAGKGSLKMPDASYTAPDVPSAGTTIVNSPFGSSVPYYGGVLSVDW